MAQERLDKFIANQKSLPRSECRRLIMHGKVTVNGNLEKKPDFKINTETDNIALLGESVEYKKFIYIMMNKPRGVLSAAEDATRETVVDLVPDKLKRKGLFPVGRLDRDTTGLLIITDDGTFAHRVISPKTDCRKKYNVVLDGEVTDDMVQNFKKGVILADGTKCRPAELIPNLEDSTKAAIIITEGRYHQVKRMFGTVGLGVNELSRESIGEMSLDPKLAEGECRELNETEIRLICKEYNKNQQNLQ